MQDYTENDMVKGILWTAFSCIIIMCLFFANYEAKIKSLQHDIDSLNYDNYKKSQDYDSLMTEKVMSEIEFSHKMMELSDWEKEELDMAAYE